MDFDYISHVVCEQQRRRSACASAQSDQHLCCSLPGYMIPILVIAEISRHLLVPSVEQAGLSLTWSQTPKTGFLVTLLKYQFLVIALSHLLCLLERSAGAKLF